MILPFRDTGKGFWTRAPTGGEGEGEREGVREGGRARVPWYDRLHSVPPEQYGKSHYSIGYRHAHGWLPRDRLFSS